MTENIPPVPPGPQYPARPPAGYNQPIQPPYAPPEGYGQQAYPQQHYPAYPQAPQGPQGTWTYTPASTVPKSSGNRVASGIIMIVLGVWMFTQFLVGVSLQLGFLALLSLIAAVGAVTSGIILLAKQRGRLRGAPVTVLTFAGFALLVSLFHVGTERGVGMFFLAFLLSVPVLIVMSLGLAKEKKNL